MTRIRKLRADKPVSKAEPRATRSKGGPARAAVPLRSTLARNEPLPDIPKTPKGRRRRQEFIDAAARALRRRGYRELSIADIAAEANAPIGLFYRYFRAKHDVVLAALQDLVERYRETIPSADRTFFEQQTTAHRNVMRLYADAPGLLGCYFSFEYGELTFADFFQDQTLRFDLEHAQRALNALNPKGLRANDLLILAHALTAMTDNFVFRYSTGRDETPALERAARIDVAVLLAQLRTRAFLLSDDSSAVASVLPSVATKAKTRPPLLLQPQSERAFSAARGKRLPKRADSTASFRTMKEAALRLLNRLSFDEMRISDIEVEGGLTRGAIYHYFGEKRELVLALLRERLTDMHGRLQNAAAQPGSHPFEDLRNAFAVFTGEYSANPGVLRSAYQLEEYDAEAADLIGEHRRAWARHLASLVAMHLEADTKARNTLIIVGYAMLAMVERACYDIYVFPFKEFQSRLRDRDLAEFLAAIWMRALFRRDPPPAVLDHYRFLRELHFQRS